ncbi:unnamed protein product [Cuscuta campestris]|uniref:Uncharacterized protein n=1 Tax=Cuscuta campestris TaxID=132261 RepID=A0A484KFE5_9ASTE|nr:unnamed protein product [Cuscuta campestris]
MATNGRDVFDTLPGGLRLFLRNLHSLVPAKLEDNNYPSWSSTVKATLIAHRLFGHVDGTDAAPPPTILDEKAATAGDKEPVMKPNPAYEQWVIIDAQLRASLLALLSPTVQNYVHMCTTAAEIWNHLHQRYNSLSHTHIFQLKEQLHNIRKGQSSMQSYLDEVLKIVNALALACEPIPEQDIILNVMRGLPPEYGSLKQNVRTNLASLTFNTVSSWLLSEELNIQLEQKLSLGPTTGSSTELHTALYASQESSSTQRGRGHFGGGRGYGRPSGSGGWTGGGGRPGGAGGAGGRLQHSHPYYGSNSVSTAGGQSLPISSVGSGQVTTATGFFDPGQSYQSGDIQRPM